MKRWLWLFLGLTILFTSVCAARSVDEARQTLAQLKMNFEEQQFLEVIRKKDNYAVSLYLDAGMSPNLVTVNNISPLKYAAIFGNLESARLLLAKEGIAVNWVDNAGLTAADYAYLFDSNDVLTLLKEKEGLQTATRRVSLSPLQVSQAATVGGMAATNKKDIIYTEKISENMPQAKAYWLTPFCSLANEKLSAVRRYETILPDRIRLLANTQQARVSFVSGPISGPGSQNANVNYLDGLRVVALQGGKILYPYWVEILPMQQATMTVVFIPVMVNKFGFIAYFNAHDFDMTKPVELKVLTKVSKELTFKFSNENSVNPTFAVEDADQFNW
jgi:hypothetical protein